MDEENHDSYRRPMDWFEGDGQTDLWTTPILRIQLRNKIFYKHKI